MYRDALIYTPFLFIMIRLSFCAFMSMCVFFVRYSLATFLILDILPQPELTRLPPRDARWTEGCCRHVHPVQDTHRYHSPVGRTRYNGSERRYGCPGESSTTFSFLRPLFSASVIAFDKEKYPVSCCIFGTLDRPTRALSDAPGQERNRRARSRQLRRPQSYRFHLQIRLHFSFLALLLYSESIPVCATPFRSRHRLLYPSFMFRLYHHSSDP